MLARGALKDVLLVGVAGDKAVNLDFLYLPNAVAPCHRLKVILFITVTHSTSRLTEMLQAAVLLDRHPKF